MTTPAAYTPFVPAPMPPSPPFVPPDPTAPFAAGRPGAFTDKQQLDVEMRQQFGTLWRDSRAQASQMKAEQREQDNARTAAHLEAQEYSAEPRMSGRKHSDADVDLGLHWSIGPRIVDDEPGNHAKRSAANAQGDSPWQHLYTTTDSDLRSDPANLQSFYNEINGLSCSDTTCRSGSDVHLDWTGAWPHEAREPFTYPVLIDNSLRLWKSDAFQAVGKPLHAVSYPAPYPFMNSQPPRNREAVRVMASSGECAHIDPYYPASCASFTAGDQVAQIDKFFSENIAQGKVPGAVFVDAAVIEKWGKESSMKGTTALAVRQDPDHRTLIFGLVGGGLAFVSGIFLILFGGTLKKCPRAVASRVQGGWESSKTMAGALWSRCTRVRTPLAPPAKPAEPAQPAMHADTEDSSVVIDDSDSDSGYLDDFSRSSSSASSASSGRSDSKAA